MSFGPASVEETLAQLKLVVSDSRKMASVAEGLERQLKALMKQEHERLNPSPLRKAARRVYDIRYLTPDRFETERSECVPAADVTLLYNRLWIEDKRGKTWVLEATNDAHVWNAVAAELPPLSPAGRPEAPIVGGEVRTVFRVKVATHKPDGRVVLRRREVNARPCRWDGNRSMAVHADAHNEMGYYLDKPELDFDGETVWSGRCPGRTGVSGGQWEDVETIKVLFQEQHSDGVVRYEKLSEVNVRNIEVDDGDGTEWVKHNGHSFCLDTCAPSSNGIYLATRHV